jgi:asparagine synthase (glutamine-hydrolysing)
MCGINGIFAYHYAANPIDRAELQRTRDHMAARGPDGKGEWISSDSRIAFGHRRLSIIDLSDRAAQPMVSDDGKLIVTFNGEIYNHLSLRKELEAEGVRFRTTSDTEVLLHLYVRNGEALVHRLRGMFVFAIHDTVRRTLLLARDPYGIKPLYYVDDGWTFRFASQVKALLVGGAVSRDPEPAGLVGFYLFGSVPEPFTTYRAVRALPAGCTLYVDRIGAGAPRPYYSISGILHDAERDAPANGIQGEEIREALLDSVRHHLIADVRVGAFLSAGIDSSALVGLMRDAGQQEIQTVTLAFEEFRGTPADEAPLAEEVSRLYGTRHVTRVVGEAEFQAELPRILEAMDQPSIDGVNTWFVSKAARESGLKVAISGLGGDELFGGYPSFIDLPRLVKHFGFTRYVPFIGKLSRQIASSFNRQLGFHPKMAGIVELGGTWPGAYLLRRGLFMPWELSSLLDENMVARGLERLIPLEQIEAVIRPLPRTPFAKVAAMESSLYMRNQLLRDTDWSAMAHSLEVRVPLVDSVLLERCARFAGHGALNKRVLAAAPATPLPPGVVNRAKTGFATPIVRWMADRAELASKDRHFGQTRGYSRFIARSELGPEAA